MQQLTQDLKKGKMEILEVPFPMMGKGQVLVRNYYSVISPGTEARTVKDARAGYIAKARERKKEVKQVIDQIKKTGLKDTFRLVMNRLEAPSPLGYSCAGEVIAISPEISDIRIGDRVACGGAGAWHADVVSIFRNLCARIPEGVDLKQAAFASIASIAIQGVRQAGVQLGEKVVVIGLGLLGRLTIQILQAGGVHTAGIDIDPVQVQSSQGSGVDLVLNRNHEDLEHLIFAFTQGQGADAVIITASSKSTDPVNLAGLLCRPRAKVVIVGAVPTGFDRENYYKKELDLRMSSSYGPGRYDPVYEEKGIDYPIGYVRWTENRNLQAFLDLLHKNKLRIDQLITHTFPLEEAPNAYSLILNRSEYFCGLVIEYDREKEPKKKVELEAGSQRPGQASVGFIGAGNFARNIILPILKNRCNLIGVATAHGHTSSYVAKKYGFEFCTDNADEIIAHDQINTVFIATRHNLHAEYVVKAMTTGKHIFVEKPLALTQDELKRIRETRNMLLSGDRQVPILMAGFNRRFSPFVKKIKNIFLSDQPKSILIRVNADRLPRTHWAHDPEIGGGRIIGEVCHFVDLALFLAGGEVSSISAKSLRDPDNLQDTLCINLGFENSSIATIDYFSNGSKKLPKEYVEVFCSGRAAIIDDFKEMKIFGKWVSRTKLRKPDKGHKQELMEFLEAIKTGGPSPIPFDELYATTLTTFAVQDSIKK